MVKRKKRKGAPCIDADAFYAKVREPSKSNLPHLAIVISEVNCV